MIYLKLKGICFEETWQGEYIHESIVNEFEYLVIVPMIIDTVVKGYGIFNTTSKSNIFIHADREVVSKVLFTISDLMARCADLERVNGNGVDIEGVGTVTYIY